MNLWQKHEVALLDANPSPYRLQFESAPETPKLDELIANFRDQKGSPFPERDLVWHRVGVLPASSEYEMHKLGIIRCFPASWAQRMLVSDPKVRAELPENERLQILSMVSIVSTSDHHIILSFRSEKMTIYPSSWHGSACGFTDLRLALETQSPLFQTFLELEEELNVLPSHIRSIRQLGLCQHTAQISLSATEFLVHVEVNLSAAELLERAKTAKDSWEGKAHAFPENKVREMLEKDNFVPSGAAALLLFLT